MHQTPHKDAVLSAPEFTKTSLAQIVRALSDALDLVGVDDVAHGKRVGIMAAQCGKVLGWDAAECEFLIDLGLLHDIGVSSTQTHQHLLLEFDWANSQDHASRGYLLLKSFSPLTRLAMPVRYHHTRWDKVQTLVGEALSEQQALEANLIFMVDRVDTFAAPYYANEQLFDHVDEIRERIRGVVGAYFAPVLVDAFMAASATEAFWLSLESRALSQALDEHVAAADHHPMSQPQLLQLAKIFAQIVDAKSPFTHAHSLGVTRLAVYLGQQLGLDHDVCARLEIAGLLHDLGKLRIPDEILDKPGPLDAHERHVMNTHSYETYQILVRIPGFEEIARIAAYHHEVPDGTGYPFHLSGSKLSQEARILRIADIFQALVQDRPYRKGLDGSEILKYLRHLQDARRIDPDIAQVLFDDMDKAMAIAKDNA